jgi:thioredoxin-like negative regulator of GroEL
MIVERLALVALLMVVAVAGFYLLRLAHMRRMSLAPATVTGLPTLLYFRSDTCAVCPTQSRYIDEVAGEWQGRVVIEQVDAAADPDTAGRYRVFTLPTTIVLDGRGQVQQVNYGLADHRKLARQLSEVSGAAAA